MTTWAQIVSGIARDVCGGDDDSPHVVPGYDPNSVGWTRVPDGTRSGAADNGNGTFTNPAALPAPPRVLGATGFMDHCYASLGGGLAGMARFAEIIRLARASGSDLVGAAVERYDCAKSGGTFAKDQAGTFAAILADPAVGIMTSVERTAILNNWPTG